MTPSGAEPPEQALARARTLLGVGQYPEAAAAARQAAEGFGRAGRPIAAGRCLRLQADALVAAGDAAGALDALDRAQQGFSAASPEGDASEPDDGDAEPGQRAHPADLVGVRAARGGALRLAGRHQEAATELAAAGSAYAALDMPARAAVCTAARGVVLHGAGDAGSAVALLAEAYPVLVAHRRVHAAASCAFDLAVAHHDLGHLDDAVEHLLAARTLFQAQGREADAAGCNQNLGVALHAMGRPAEAVQRLEAARATYLDLGRVRDAEQCDHNLDAVRDALANAPEPVDVPVHNAATSGDS